jgi:low affinity Fe/Cu permease
VRDAALRTVRHVITSLGVYTARPAAFVILGVYVTVWLIFSPASFDWHAAATVATWFMTLLIQRAEHRDTQAIHLKHEILRVLGDARNELMSADEDEPEEIEHDRARMRRRI